MNWAGLLDAAVAISRLGGGESSLALNFWMFLELAAGGGWLQLVGVVR